MKLAFVGYKKQEKYSKGSPKDEDKVLLDLFKEKKLNVDFVIWNDPTVDWQIYDRAIVKSPWDYHEKFPEFLNWLDKLTALNVGLLNPDAILRWNSDKQYLKDIENAGLPVIQSRFLGINAKPTLQGFFSELETEKLVIKPCISASAKNTLVVTKQNISESEQQLHALLTADTFIVQPFVKEIYKGEISLIFLGSKYSHSVIKRPKPGDFRVQHFHGGTVSVYDPSKELIAEAEKYVELFAPGCLYARVDGLFIGEVFHLMELELIEPYLFLDINPGAYERYYEAMIELLRMH